MESLEFAFRAGDGADLFVRGWSAEEPKAIVQVLHGMAEHGDRYERLAKALGRAGSSAPLTWLRIEVPKRSSRLHQVSGGEPAP